MPTAVQGGFAVPAYNFNNMEQLQAIIMACLETQSPVIIQVSKGAREALRAMYGRKNRDVLGSAGRAPEIMRAMKG